MATPFLLRDSCPSVQFSSVAQSFTVMQIYAPTTNAEEAEVDPFCEDLQHLLELTPKRDILFFIGDWNKKVRSQEKPRITGKFVDYKMKQDKG